MLYGSRHGTTNKIPIKHIFFLRFIQRFYTKPSNPWECQLKDFACAKTKRTTINLYRKFESDSNPCSLKWVAI